MGAHAHDCDVLIAGGGPAGSALALALADGRRRIVVVEARAGAPGGDARATALAAGAVRLLDALGAWPALAPDAVAIRRVEVSQQGHLGRTRIDAADEGVAALGRVVAYDRLARALADAAAAAPGVSWRAPARVTGADAGATGVSVRVETADGTAHLRTRLAVAADGTRSPLRAALGIAASVHDYGQTALLAQVDAGGDPHTAHERFSADGPLALLPGGGARRTLVWTVPAARADTLAALDPDAFAEAAAHRLGRRLGPLRLRTAPVGHALARTTAARTVAQRAALVGNAAATLHPVAAQSFNLALRDVCALAAILDDAGGDPGDAATLAAWARARRADRWRTLALTDALARGGGAGGDAAAALRAGALVGLDLCGAGRHVLAAQTMGLLGGLPRVGRWRLGAAP